MIARAVSWFFVVIIVYASYVGIKHWSNPWKVTTPIAAVLPPAYNGCGEKCTK